MLSSLSKSKGGQKLIDRINNISTKISIDPKQWNKFGRFPDANSLLIKENLMPSGYYEKATIQPYLNRYDPKTEATFDEWLGAVITVEMGHLEKDQVAVEEAEVKKDKDLYQKPTSEGFKIIYTPLMNMATRFMLQYRDEKGLNTIPYNFSPVLGYHLKLDDENQKRKDTMNNINK